MLCGQKQSFLSTDFSNMLRVCNHGSVSMESGCVCFMLTSQGLGAYYTIIDCLQSSPFFFHFFSGVFACNFACRLIYSFKRDKSEANNGEQIVSVFLLGVWFQVRMRVLHLSKTRAQLSDGNKFIACQVHCHSDSIVSSPNHAIKRWAGCD